ncbi:hypothetical protein K525DRAFT_209390 [Schizophyllum commune Loenen D]|nr:hypothetical protein K525DRAFT_209390 [Schizophyllum commune Loenen D]
MASQIPPSQGPQHTRPDVEMPPADNDGSTAKGKGKRRRDPTPPISDRAESPIPTTKKPRPAPNKPSSASARTQQSPADYHVKEEHIPKAAGPTKRALILHVRILWKLYHQGEMPPDVTKEMKERFEDRYNTEAEVAASVRAAIEDESVSAALDNIPKEVRALKDKLLSSSRSTISDSIRAVADMWIVEAYKGVARVGLTRWAPDVFDSPDSIYNKLHEYIALETFTVLTGGGAYRLKGEAARYARKLSLIGAIYRSFVFSHMRDKAKLRDNRMEVLIAQSFDTTVLSLANETEAHSDDECLSDNEDGTEIYRIRNKEPRSTKVKTFLRMLDQHVPIDWFDPDYWNNTLTVRERADIIKDGKRIALPKAEHCQTMEQCRKWKNLSEDEFWQKYGEDVLAQYAMPTEKELELLRKGDWEKDEDEDEAEEDDVEQQLGDGDTEMR